MHDNMNGRSLTALVGGVRPLTPTPVRHTFTSKQHVCIKCQSSNIGHVGPLKVWISFSFLLLRFLSHMDASRLAIMLKSHGSGAQNGARDPEIPGLGRCSAGPTAPWAILSSRQSPTNAAWQPRLSWRSNERPRGPGGEERSRRGLGASSESDERDGASCARPASRLGRSRASAADDRPRPAN